jgi:hypothetical protein
MNEPIKQHYIPQSYLKYFATENCGDFIVDVYDPRIGTRLRKQNISGICFKRHLYTLKNVPPDKKYFVEKFYAEHVDTNFTSIHSILTNPNIQYITLEQKEMIILSLLSLYFRTTKFLQGSIVMIEKMIDEIVVNSKEEVIHFSLENIKYTFKKSEIDQFKNELKEEHRLSFVLSHVEYWQDFYKKKLKNGMQVCKIVDDGHLITSDNPVIINSYNDEKFNLYNSKNIIQIPIDKNHYLFLLPDEDKVDPLFIARGDRDKRFALTNNKQMEDRSERWIISDLGGIDKHLDEQERYGEKSTENLLEVNKMRERAKYFVIINELSNKYGGNMHVPEILQLFDKYSTLEIFKDDPSFWQLYNKLKNT